MTSPSLVAAAPQRVAPARGNRQLMHRAVSSIATQWGAVLICALMGLRITELIPGISVLRPSILMFLVTWAIWARGGVRKLRTLLVSPNRYYAAFIALSLALVPTSIWVGGSIEVLRVVPFGLTVLIALASLDHSPNTRDRVIWGLVISAIILCVLVLASGRAKFDVLGGDRLYTGGSLDPNDLASAGAILFMLSLGYMLRVRSWFRRGICIFACGLCAVVVMKTGSRGGVLAMAAGVMVLIAGMKRTHAAAVVLIMVLGIPAAWEYGPETFRVRTASLLTISEDYTYTARSGRTQIWKRGLGYFLQNPVLGVGPGNFGTYEGRQNMDQGIGGAWLTAHNTFLQSFVETGLFGGLLLLSALGSAMIATFRAWGQRVARTNPLGYCPELLAATVAFTVGAVFLSHSYSYLTFFTLGLANLSLGSGTAPLRAASFRRAQRQGEPRGWKSSHGRT